MQTVKRRRMVSIILMLVMLFAELAPSFQVHAQDIHNIPVTTQYRQSEARKQLDLVNAFRTGDEAWHYDENNNVVYDTGLSTLTWDYGLERVALLRAVETAIYWSHTRPDGSDCFTAYGLTNCYRGENLLAGLESADSAVRMWKETNDDYSGQGHRRNMLDKQFKYMAAACVVYKGCTYWVQEFCSKPIDTTPTAADDGVHTDLITANISEGAYIEATIGEDTVIKGEVGSEVELPLYSGVFHVNGDYYSTTIDLPVSWTLGDPGFGTISNGKLLIKKAAVTKLYGSYNYLDMDYTCEYTLDSRIYAKSVSVSPSSFVVTKGETVSINVTVLPAGAIDGAITYSSSNTSAATVSQYGVITAVGNAGQYANIRATTESGLYDECHIDIADTPWLEASVDSTGYSDMKTGDSKALPKVTAGGTYSSLTYPEPMPELKMSISDNTVAVISDNKVYAVGAGETTLTVDAGTFYGTKYAFSWDIKVADPVILPESISLNYTSVTMAKGDQVELRVTGILPVEAKDCELTYSSLDESVATVSSNGVISAVGSEDSSTRIRVTAVNDVYAQCRVYIVSAPVLQTSSGSSKYLDMTEGSAIALPVILPGGNYFNLTRPQEAPEPDFFITDSSVAVISANRVYAVGAGETMLKSDPVIYYGTEYDFSWKITVKGEEQPTPAPDDPTPTPDEPTPAPDPDPVVSEDTYAITMKVGQTEARKFEKLINDFRTGSEAWYYDQSGAKVSAGNLGKLSWDYGIEKAAIQRAAEAAVIFSHTRPNGDSCFTAYPSSYGRGENLAAGHNTASATMEQWKETNEGYSGQGHRRNMLGSNYTAFAVGHVTLNGYDYWAMGLAASNSGEASFTVWDSEGEILVEIAGKYITGSEVNASLAKDSTIELSTGVAKKLPTFSGSLKVSGNWPGKDIGVKIASPTWTLSDPDFADIADGKITAKKGGTCTLTASFKLRGQTYKYNYKLHVKVSPSEVILNPTSADLSGDDTLQLKWTVLPDDAEDKSVKFKSSDTTVVTVDKNGLVTAVGAGKAKVTITTNDGGKTADCDISVKVEYTVAAPRADISSGEVEPGTVVRLSSNTPDAKIYYTTDGSDPDADNGKLYKDGIKLDTDVTIKAVAFKNDVYSGISAYKYTIGAENWGDITEEDKAQWKDLASVPEGIWVAEASVPVLTYTGKALKPAGFRVYLGRKLLTTKDYSISYTENTNAGKAAAIFKFKGDLSGSLKQAFIIQPADISEAAVGSVSVVYSGSAVTAYPVVMWKGKTLAKDTDYIIDNADAYTDPGTYELQINGKGNFAGTNAFSLIISKPEGESIAKATVSKIPAQTYTEGGLKQLCDKKGNPLAVSVKIGSETLIEGTDYSTSIIGGDKPGTAALVITAKGNKCYGSKTVYFEVKARTMKSFAAVEPIAAVVYNGEAQTPEIKISDKKSGMLLVKDVHYTVSYTKNVAAGKGKVTIEGIEAAGYTGKLNKTFKIDKASIAGAEVKYSDGAYYVKGGAVTDISVTLNGRVLKEGTDYTVKYSGNKKAGAVANFVVIGKGSLKGKLSAKEFTVMAKPLAEVNGYAADVISGASYKSKPVLTDTNGKKLMAGTDYKLDGYFYDEDCFVNGSESRVTGQAVKAGDVIPEGTVLRMRLSGKGSYSGTYILRYRVCGVSIKNASAKIADMYYTGEAVKPARSQITIVVNGTALGEDDFEIVSYSNNIKPGTAKVTVRGKGRYGGEKTISFKIIRRSAE